MPKIIETNNVNDDTNQTIPIIKIYKNAFLNATTKEERQKYMDLYIEEAQKEIKPKLQLELINRLFDKEYVEYINRRTAELNATETVENNEKETETVKENNKKEKEAEKEKQKKQKKGKKDKQKSVKPPKIDPLLEASCSEKVLLAYVEACGNNYIKLKHINKLCRVFNGVPDRMIEIVKDVC